MREAPHRSEVMGPPGFGVECLVCRRAALAAAASTHVPVRTVPFKVELTRKDKNAERKPPRRKLSQVLGKNGARELSPAGRWCGKGTESAPRAVRVGVARHGTARHGTAQHRIEPHRLGTGADWGAGRSLEDEATSYELGDAPVSGQRRGNRQI